MKIQIQKFSMHQNAKVFAVLMAVSSLVFVIPFTLIAGFAAPKDAGFPRFMMLLVPIFYLVIGYVMVAVGCWIYNFVAQYIGGLEYESKNVEG
jgi:Zn-dependent protease with chaperone function